MLLAALAELAAAAAAGLGCRGFAASGAAAPAASLFCNPGLKLRPPLLFHFTLELCHCRTRRSVATARQH